MKKKPSPFEVQKSEQSGAQSPSAQPTTATQEPVYDTPPTPRPLHPIDATHPPVGEMEPIYGTPPSPGASSLSSQDPESLYDKPPSPRPLAPDPDALNAAQTQEPESVYDSPLSNRPLYSQGGSLEDIYAAPSFPGQPSHVRQEVIYDLPSSTHTWPPKGKKRYAAYDKDFTASSSEDGALDTRPSPEKEPIYATVNKKGQTHQNVKQPNVDNSDPDLSVPPALPPRSQEVLSDLEFEPGDPSVYEPMPGSPSARASMDQSFFQSRGPSFESDTSSSGGYEFIPNKPVRADSVDAAHSSGREQDFGPAPDDEPIYASIPDIQAGMASWIASSDAASSRGREQDFGPAPDDEPIYASIPDTPIGATGG
ncbi:hypothetical protein, partial [Bartonella phoceensis]|uniref:hypothetical protein n=1 Tax=Bartonella phoceensis TaxID=270249 RepID=UPI001ABBB970